MRRDEAHRYPGADLWRVEEDGGGERRVREQLGHPRVQRRDSLAHHEGERDQRCRRAARRRGIAPEKHGAEKQQHAARREIQREDARGAASGRALQPKLEPTADGRQAPEEGEHDGAGAEKRRERHRLREQQAAQGRFDRERVRLYEQDERENRGGERQQERVELVDGEEGSGADPAPRIENVGRGDGAREMPHDRDRDGEQQDAEPRRDAEPPRRVPAQRRRREDRGERRDEDEERRHGSAASQGSSSRGRGAS